ncbi:hypothetical protein, partial [Tabrizicola sp.]|uniref:hypothetical protein n=1 Tax=Tabrizicola sp. TaxID=2005166 RepID=UPI0025E6868A
FRLSIETSDSVETPYLGVHETGSSSPTSSHRECMPYERQMGRKVSAGIPKDRSRSTTTSRFDYLEASKALVDINATSTCDCGLHTGFACECLRMRSSAETKIPPKQRLVI